MRILLAASLVLALFAGCTAPSANLPDVQPDVTPRGADTAVVVAVVDSRYNPYHFDFRADLMPQALDQDPSNDLPLDQDPSSWLPGFPDISSFASYSQLDLTLSNDDEAVPQTLHDGDKDAWSKVKTSTADSVHLSWIPGTKIIGLVTFSTGSDGFSSGSHGVGTSSVAVGNHHGACPECLVVLVDGTSEQANRWVESQSWLDVQTNSWGFSSNPVGLPRDRVYAGSDTAAQLAAVERGQQIFFSAGNGLMNDFSAPNPTLMSSQEGPDWMVTVGAVTPDDQSAYSGAGKPADIANIGSGYPSAYGSTTVNSTNDFGGTSNATPVTAGEYARALWLARWEMRGTGGVIRAQEGGIVSQPGHGTDNEAITVHQMRTALYNAAEVLNPEWNAAGQGAAPAGATPREATLMAIGHGTLTGRLMGLERLHEETNRIAEFALGLQSAPEVDADTQAWFVADSLCRQSIWGAWEHGDFNGNSTAPADDPQWPTRTFYVNGCPVVLKQAVAAVKTGTAATPLLA